MNFHLVRRAVALSFLFLAVHAMAQEDFSKAWPSVTYYTKQKIRISVLDEREYVKSGRYGSDYIGILRGAYGMPSSVKTSDSRPLARELESAINSGFANAGIDSSIAVERGKATGPDDELSLVIVLKEWYSDSYRNSVGFIHNASVAVYDPAGNELVSESSEASKTFSSPLEGCRDALTQVLTKDAIVAALTKPEHFRNTGKRTPEAASEKTNDPKTRLLRLKELLDRGAISAQDYEKKKAEILKIM